MQRMICAARRHAAGSMPALSLEFATLSWLDCVSEACRGERSMGQPTIILIGADKGGVGKTTVTRTLLDYFRAHEVPVRAFDTEPPNGTLQRFHPEISEIVDVTSILGQMRIFDTVSDATVTVVDVRAGLLSPTLRALRDIELLDSAKQGLLTLIVFHVVGSSITSLEGIEDTVSYTTGVKYFLVKNFINDTSFFEWDQATYHSYFNKIGDIEEVTIPKLREMAYEQVELASVPFSDFIANKTKYGEVASYSLVVRGYVRHWLRQVWNEYERIRLKDIIGGTGDRNFEDNGGSVDVTSSETQSPTLQHAG